VDTKPKCLISILQAYNDININIVLQLKSAVKPVSENQQCLKGQCMFGIKNVFIF